MAGGEGGVNIPRRHAVDDVRSLHFVIREDAQHAARPAVVGGDHRIATRRWVFNSAEIDIVQHRQIGRAGINVALRIEQIAAARRAGFPLRAEDVFTGAVLDNLHQPQRVGTAHRVRVERGFGLHNRQDQRLVHAILTRRLTHHAQILMRTLVEVVRDKVNGNAVDNLQAVRAALQARLQQVVGKFRGATFPADRLSCLVDNLTVQERLFRNGDVVRIGVEIDRSRIVTHQQGFDDRLTQPCRRVGACDGLNGDRTLIKVDVATGQIGVGVLNVVLRSGNKNFVKSPYVLDVMGKLPHQNVKTVGVLDPGFVVIIAFFGRARDQQRRNKG